MNPPSMEQKAGASALKYVANLFQRPDQLENLDVVRKKAGEKKTVVEAMLRTGVQSQLEGIRSAINHLQMAKSDIQHIEQGMNNIRNNLTIIPILKARMAKLNDANIVHSQYAAAVNNLKHISNINETIAQTEMLIEEEKLLEAHKNIMELEMARDDLMNEVYKVESNRRELDLNLLKTYFGDVNQLVKKLGKKVWMICSRTLEAVQSDTGATQVVSALRIIERERRIDVYYKDQKATQPNSFMPPDRPREWEKQWCVVMENVVRQRVEGSQFEDRSTNRQWLARYLEVCREIVVKDLKVVKSKFVKVFPPDYSIYSRMLKFYHVCVTDKIKELASTPLEKNELVQLLLWIKNYDGETMLGDPELEIQTVMFFEYYLILPQSTMDQMLDQLFELTQKDLSQWMDNLLVREKDDWYKHVEPEEDSTHFYCTQLPSNFFGMITDQLNIIKTVSLGIVPRFIDTATNEFLATIVKLKDAITVYRNKHFEDRSFFKFFTRTMIALANNIDLCIDSTNKLEKHIRLIMEVSLNHSTTDSRLAARLLAGSFQVNKQELIDKINSLKQQWQRVMQMAILALFDEISKDINKHLEKLFTRSWLMDTTSDLETICETIRDYSYDYQHLKPYIRFSLLNEILYKVVGEYIIAIESRRMSFNNYKERNLAAERIRSNSVKIGNLFDSLSRNEHFQFPPIISILSPLADILDMCDKSLLSLEVSSFVRKYPDVHAELLSSLMFARGDIGRNEAKTIADEALNHMRFHPKGDKEMLKLFQLFKAGGRQTMPTIANISMNLHNLLSN